MCLCCQCVTHSVKIVIISRPQLLCPGCTGDRLIKLSKLNPDYIVRFNETELGWLEAWLASGRMVGCEVGTGLASWWNV